MIEGICNFLQYLMSDFIVIIILINTRALLALDDCDLACYPAREKISLYSQYGGCYATIITIKSN
nr:MAG TPA: hypothetical protein [Caudoviricetes sp.]